MKSVEPFYIVQSIVAAEDRETWLKDNVSKSKEEGANFLRVTVHEGHQDLCLFEAWKDCGCIQKS